MTKNLGKSLSHNYSDAIRTVYVSSVIKFDKEPTHTPIDTHIHIYCRTVIIFKVNVFLKHVFYKHYISLLRYRFIFRVPMFFFLFLFLIMSYFILFIFRHYWPPVHLLIMTTLISSNCYVINTIWNISNTTNSSISSSTFMNLECTGYALT